MGNLFIFIFYSFVYLVGYGWLIWYIFGFSPFMCFSSETKELFVNPLSDWSTLYRDFVNDKWVINSWGDTLMLVAFLSFFPLWIGLWVRLSHAQIIKKILKPFHAIKRRQLNDAKPQQSTLKTSLMMRPKPMPRGVSFGSSHTSPSKNQAATQSMQSMPNNAMSAAPVTGGTALSSSTETTSSTGEFTQAFVEQMRQLGERYGCDLFEKVRLDDVTVPLVLATDTRAFLMTFLLDGREWIADEEVSEDAIEPTWFSAQGLIPSPFYMMSKAAATLAEKEPTSDIIPVVVLCNGSILNAQAMQQTWQEQGGFVVTWQSASDDNLMTLEEVISQASTTLTEENVS